MLSFTYLLGRNTFHWSFTTWIPFFRNQTCLRFDHRIDQLISSDLLILQPIRFVHDLDTICWTIRLVDITKSIVEILVAIIREFHLHKTNVIVIRNWIAYDRNKATHVSVAFDLFPLCFHRQFPFSIYKRGWIVLFKVKCTKESHFLAKMNKSLRDFRYLWKVLAQRNHSLSPILFINTHENVACLQNKNSSDDHNRFAEGVIWFFVIRNCCKSMWECFLC